MWEEKASYNVQKYVDDIWENNVVNETIDYNDGFIFLINFVEFENEEFNSFINDILKHHGKLIEYDYSYEKNNINKKFKNDKIRIYIKGDLKKLRGEIRATSEEIKCSIWSLYIKNSCQRNYVNIELYSYFMKQGNLEYYYNRINPEDINYVNDKYYPYINTSIMFDQFFTGYENILLVIGKPGIGKSKLATLAIKYAYENSDKLPYDKLKIDPSLKKQYIKIVYVKSTDVLISDSFWRMLDVEIVDFVIIDDLDYMLTKRSSEIQSNEDTLKNIFLNQFLSFVDGFQKKKTKFIITTNQNNDDIDTALLRKGRLFDILELRLLNKEESLVIWEENKLCKDEFNKIFTSSEISAADLGSEINKHLNKRITNSKNNYLKEECISRIDTAGINKKITL